VRDASAFACTYSPIPTLGAPIAWCSALAHRQLSLRTPRSTVSYRCGHFGPPSVIVADNLSLYQGIGRPSASISAHVQPSIFRATCILGLQWLWRAGFSGVRRALPPPAVSATTQFSCYSLFNTVLVRQSLRHGLMSPRWATASTTYGHLLRRSKSNGGHLLDVTVVTFARSLSGDRLGLS